MKNLKTISVALGAIFAFLSYISNDAFHIFMPLAILFLGLNLFIMSHEYSKNNNKSLSYTCTSVGIIIYAIMFYIVIFN